MRKGTASKSIPLSEKLGYGVVAIGLDRLGITAYFQQEIHYPFRAA